MRTESKLALATALALALAVAAVAPAANPSKQAVTMTPDQLKWVPNPEAPQIMTAVAWGDPTTGPHGAFDKFPAGFVSPLHTHTADLRILVVSGTMAMADESGRETALPTGSYFYQPNTFKHVTKCKDGSDCVAFVMANGKFDVKPVGEQEAGAAK